MDGLLYTGHNKAAWNRLQEIVVLTFLGDIMSAYIDPYTSEVTCNRGSSLSMNDASIIKILLLWYLPDFGIG